MEPKPRKKPGPDSTRDAKRPEPKTDVPLETYERSSGRGSGGDAKTNLSQPTGAEHTARDEP